MLMGAIGCGKTTLTQYLHGQELKYNKTQAIQFHSDVIDTPGEFIQHRNLYSALLITAADAELLVLIASAVEKIQTFSPQFASAFNKPCIGVISKIDLATSDEIEKIERQLRIAGARQIFRVSSTTGEGMEQLIKYLSDDD